MGFRAKLANVRCRWHAPILSTALCALALNTSAQTAGSTAPQGVVAVGEAVGSGGEPTKQQCIAAHLECQEAQSSGRLLRARQDAIVCTNRACPAALVSDCANWLDELDRRIPSVVFEVNLNGVLNKTATIDVDGQPVGEWTHGEALQLNPGAHRIKVELDSHPPVIQEVLLAEGMRFRLITADIKSAAVSPEASKPEPEALHVSKPAVAETKLERPVPVLVYPLAGLGVAGLATFVGFSLSANSEYDRLSRTCAPFCRDDEVNAVKRRYLIGDISLGISGAALTGAAVLYLTRPTKASAPRVGVVPVPGGGVATFTVQRY